MKEAYGAHKEQDQSQLDQLKAKAAKSKLTQDERERGTALQKNLANIRQRETEQREGLQKKQSEEKQALADKQKTQTERTEQTIHQARRNRQVNGWKPEPAVFDEATVEKGKMSFQKPAQSAESSQGTDTPPKSLSDAPRPVLAPKGARTGALNPSGQQAGAARASGKGMGL